MSYIPSLRKHYIEHVVPELMKRALPGMNLTHVSVPPSAMTPKVGFQYFSLGTTGPCWEHILQTRRIGLYIPGEIPRPEFDLVVLLDS